MNCSSWVNFGQSNLSKHKFACCCSWLSPAVFSSFCSHCLYYLALLSFLRFLVSLWHFHVFVILIKQLQQAPNRQSVRPFPVPSPLFDQSISIPASLSWGTNSISCACFKCHWLSSSGMTCFHGGSKGALLSRDQSGGMRLPFALHVRSDLKGLQAF